MTAVINLGVAIPSSPGFIGTYQWLGVSALALFDVRTEAERKIAKIEGAKLLDRAAVEEIEGMDKGTTLVFHCHHGMRSQAAAERFAAQGYRNVYNLLGGIDAWSQAVAEVAAAYCG